MNEEEGTLLYSVTSNLARSAKSVGAKGIAVDPLFPADWDYLVLENLRYRGHDVTVRWQRGDGLSVYVDGKLHSRRVGR